MLFERLRALRPRLEHLLAEADQLYLRGASLAVITGEIVGMLEAVGGNRELRPDFLDSLRGWADGTESLRRRLVANAFLQARFFLQLALHCAEKVPVDARTPEGINARASLLRLYRLVDIVE